MEPLNLPEYEINIDCQKEDIVAQAKDLALQIKSDWKIEDLKDKVFNDGITNVLVGIYHQGNKDEMILIRMYGHNTDQIIDREAEIVNMKLFRDHKCGPDLLATFKNGIAYSFLPGIIPTSEMIIEPKFNQLVIEMMAKMHKMKLGGSPSCWDRLRWFLRACPDGFPDDPDKQKRLSDYGIMSKAELEQEIDFMEGQLKSSQSPVVFCHNDLLLGNIVYNQKENKVTFIDYEYGASNYQALDIGNHFAEFVGVSDQMDYRKWYPDRKFQLDWITRYLTAFNNGSTPSDTEVHRTYVDVNKFSLVAHLTWGIWALVQAKNSSLDFDFLDYAMQRLNEFKRNKDSFLALN